MKGSRLSELYNETTHFIVAIYRPLPPNKMEVDSIQDKLLFLFIIKSTYAANKYKKSNLHSTLSNLPYFQENIQQFLT